MGINHLVHHRNAKGKIVRVTPYRLIVENGIRVYEMPKGSGKFFDESGAEVDRKSIGVKPQARAENDRILKLENENASLQKQNAEILAKVDALLSAQQVPEATVLTKAVEPEETVETVTPAKAVDMKDTKNK